MPATVEEFETELRSISLQYSKSNDENEYAILLTEENYKKFEQIIRRHGMAFSVRGSEEYSRNDRRRISWSTSNISYSGMPFIVEKVSTLQCANGPKYFGGTKDLNTLENDHPTGKRKRFRLQPSKKVDCKATMKVVRIKRYPEYNVKGMKNLKDEKADILKSLKTQLESDVTSVLTQIVYYVSFHGITAHCHSVYTTFMNQELDPVLKSEIQKLVDTGITQIQTIKITLSKWVHDNIGGNVDPSCRAFYPKEKVIRNYVLKYIYATKQSKIDPDEGTSSAVVPSSELLGSPQNSVSVSTIRELIKNIYDRSFLLPHESYDMNFYNKLKDVTNVMNNFINYEDNVPLLPTLTRERSRVSELPRPKKRAKKNL